MKLQLRGTALRAVIALAAMLLGGSLLAVPAPAAERTSPDSAQALLAQAAQERTEGPATPLARHTAQQQPACRQVQGSGDYAGQTLEVCEEQRNPASRQARHELRDKVRPLRIIDPPQWCIDRAFTGWNYNRYDACNISDHRLTIYQVPSGRVIGTMDFFQWAYSYLADDLEAWAFQIELQPIRISGAAHGVSAYGDAGCTGACILAESTFPLQRPRLGEEIEGEAYFDTTATGRGDVGYAETSWLRGWIGPWVSPLPVFSSPPDVRCDRALPGNTSIGCVFPDYEPIYDVSLTGPYPNYARHLRDALDSGLVGEYGSQQPLERLTNGDLRERNGRTACPSESSGGYPRPQDHSCDEYPFRSTWQGAFTSGDPPHPGRTFDWCQISQLGAGSGPNGWSACMIPADENTAAGRDDLRVFYNDNRVIESDDFFVRVID